MARFLSLDWSHQQLLVVSATIRRGTVQIEQAAAWQEEQNPGLENAAALGQILRDRLKSAGIAPAPVLACLGRDRIVLKDIRYPRVTATEEPAIVRFQAVKELTRSPDEVVIDYLPLSANGDSSGQRALVVIVERELVAAWRNLCQAAGLKLAALTPRPWATAACWRSAVQAKQIPAVPDEAVALLTVTAHWGEFCVVHGTDLLFTRPIAAADRESALLGEIRRNLTVYSNQSPQHPVRAMCLSSSGEHDPLRVKLQEALAVPVHSFDPLAGIQSLAVPAGLRSGFAGAVGLLHGMSEGSTLPINLAQPKEPRPPEDHTKRRGLLAAAVAAVALVVAVGWGVTELLKRDRELVALNLARTDLDSQLALVEEDAKRIKTLGDWVNGEVVWLDELYDLTDRFPNPTTLRMTQLTGQMLPSTGKEKYAARLALKGITTEDPRAVDALVSQLVQDQYYRVDPKVVGRNTGTERFRFPNQFTTQVDIAKRPPSRYLRHLLSAAPKPPPGRGGMGDDDDWDLGTGFGFGEGQP